MLNWVHYFYSLIGTGVGVGLGVGAGVGAKVGCGAGVSVGDVEHIPSISILIEFINSSKLLM